MARPFRLLPVALLCACTAGEPAGSPARCEAGTVTDCRCDDGTRGIRTCSEAGRYLACDCRPRLELGGNPDPLGVADRLVDFGVIVSDGGAVATLPVRNAGGGELVLDLGTVSAPFTLVQAPVFLEAGEEGNLGFRFAASRPGESESIVTVTSNCGAATIRLAARRVESRVSCQPADLDLGAIVVGSPAPFSITCRDEAGHAWPATAWADETAAAEVQVAVDEPLPGDDGVWVVSGTVTASRTGSLSLAVHLGQGDEPRATVPLRASARAIAVEVPEFLDLGLFPPGIEVSRGIPLENHGSVDAFVNHAYLAPGSDPQYRFTWQEPVRIPARAPGGPAGKAYLRVDLAPVEARLGHPAQATLVLSIEGEAAPRSVDLLFWGGGPVIACAADRLDFGAVAVGTSAILPLTCENAGYDLPARSDDNLLVTEVESADPAFAAWPQAEHPPAGYAAGESFTLHVRFTPEVEGPVQGTLRIHSNGSLGVPLPIEVAGTGLGLAPCEYEVIPPALDFGLLGPEGATLAFAVHNRGSDRCLLRNLRLAESCEPAFSLPDGPVASAVLEPGERLPVPVRLALPVTAAAQPIACEARFEISNPASPSVVLPLRAAGTSCLAFDPPEVDFGPARPGCLALTRTVKATNVCPGPLVVTGADTAPGSEAFRAVGFPETAVALPAGAGFTFEVAFSPATEGLDRGGIRVRSGDGFFLLPVRGEGTGNPSRTDVFAQVLPPEVDVLFVIDNTWTVMAQTALGNNVEPLLSFGLAEGIDFQIGVTTSGLTGAGDCPGGAGGAEDGRLFPVDGSRPRILRPDTPDLASVLAQNFAVGSCGEGHQLLEAALRALTPPVIDHCDDPRHPQPNDGNCGFRRPDAALAIVALTDSVDNSPDSPAAYTAAFRALGSRPDRVRFHAITGDRTTGCWGGPGNASPGDRLLDVVDATSGTFHSYCLADWASMAHQLSRDLFGLESCFWLGGRPDPAAGLVVKLNGVVIPEGSWTYRADDRAICFSALAIPEPGSRIEVTYENACL